MGRLLKTFSIVLCLAVLSAASCQEKQEPPTPGGKTAIDEGQTTNPDNPEVVTPDPEACLCKEEYLGQKPMIIAYLTEYTDASTLDATCLTHINYAHGRFKNPKTGDGGIEIAKTDLLKKVIALKQKKPTLKVLLMIGWDSSVFLQIR